MRMCSTAQRGLPQLQRSQVEMTGCVIGAPRIFGRVHRFDFEVSTVAGSGRPIGSVMALADYRDSEPLEPGECYRIKARISAPAPSLNPGNFDYVARLFTQSIVHKGYLLDAIPIQSDSLNAALTRGRFYLKHRVLDALGPSNQSALVVALALGLRDELSEPIRDVLRDDGHGTPVSGVWTAYWPCGEWRFLAVSIAYSRERPIGLRRRVWRCSPRSVLPPFMRFSPV